MKKIAALLMALALCLSMTLAMAETSEAAEVPAAEASGNALQDAWDSVVKFSDEAGVSVQEWVEGATNDVEGFFNDMWAQLSGWFDQVDTFFNESGDSISTEVTNAWNVVKEAADNVGDWTAEQVNAAIATLTDWLNQSGDAIGQGVQDAVNGVISLFNGEQTDAQ